MHLGGPVGTLMFERLSSEPIYNTRAVVQRTGVPADTFRAWERRYGLPNPTRTPGNQRLYTERDIATIAWLRDQTNGGMTISQAIMLFNSTDSPKRLQGPSGEKVNGVTPRTGAASASPYEELRDRLVDALVSLDGMTADRIVEESLAMTNVETVCLHVLQASLISIGDRWQHGSANIAMEHFAASYVQRKFGALFNQSNPDEGRGPIVAACPEGEQHDIGLLLNCVFLSRRGYKIVYLGANLPLDDLAQTVERVQPPLVILSATREETARRIGRAVPRLKLIVSDIPGKDLPEIGYGGHIFVHRPDLREGIDGTFLGMDARETVTHVDRIFSTLSG